MKLQWKVTPINFHVLVAPYLFFIGRIVCQPVGFGYVSATFMIPQAKVAHLKPDQLLYLKEAFRSTVSLDDLAAELNFPGRNQLLLAIAKSLRLEVVELDEISIDANVLENFPQKLIHRFEVFPIALRENEIQLAVGNPFDLNIVDEVAAVSGFSVLPVVADAEKIRGLIKQNFGVGAETIDGMMSLQDDTPVAVQNLQGQDLDDAEMAQQASVVRLVNEILTAGIESRTSDVHIESQEKSIKIRYRIDGVLQRQPTPPDMNRFRNAIVSRLKIMAKLNIAEKRIPQDGRIKMRVKGREIDIRVSIIPMLHGEGIVMRILDKDNLAFSLRGVGMPESIYDQFNKLIQLPHGIVLVTGPTGSGKTTTLYSALGEIKNEGTKIITVEDPIEYQLEGINQIQVHNKVGLTFASSLRSILRHDPDVVLVGEIRDLETAENAIQASLTGHLVFSTLHTNDSASAFMRLSDMGVEPFLATSTVEGVLAQRLVRILCSDCCQAVDPSQLSLPDDFPFKRIDNAETTLKQPIGCPQCRQSGYRGRIGIFELLVANEEIRELAGHREPSTKVKQAALASGMKSLRNDGWDKALAGTTTVAEVLRVTKAD
ncbi:MAG: type II secretion system protein E [Mariniblastus sp.]|jgi:type II secretion system protein E